jgi:hypothetical protein
MPSNPYYDMFPQAGSPVTMSPNYNDPMASSYPQPQRPNSPQSASQSGPGMLNDVPLSAIDQQDFQNWEDPRQAPSEAFPFNQAWRDNAFKSFGGDKIGDMNLEDAKSGISDFFSGIWAKGKDLKNQMANRDKSKNLTEEFGKAIPRAASSVYNAGKNIYDEATNPANMRGPFAEMYMNRTGLQDKPEMQMRGMEPPPLEMPNSQQIRTPMPQGEDAQNLRDRVGEGSGVSEFVRSGSISDYMSQNPSDMTMSDEVTPLEALGAKMRMGGKGAIRGAGDAISNAGGAIANAPRGAAEMAGRGLGGTFKYGGSLVDAFKKGWMGDQASQAEAPQAESGGLTPKVATKQVSKQSGGFKGAFASARKSGKGEFTYKGKKYNTRLKGQTSKPVSKKKKKTTNKATPYLSR